jgi:nucleoid-associated protein YgaU
MTNQSPAKTGLSYDKTAALDKAPADVPVIDVAHPSASQEIASDFQVTPSQPAPLPALDPIESETPPAPSTPLAFPTAPVLKDREVMRVETIDFILTVERPRREDPPPTTPHPTTPINGRESVHIVVRGDTLWHIAQGYLGDPFRYPELAALSHIKNPDLIYPGDIVRIRKKNTGKP